MECERKLYDYIAAIRPADKARLDTAWERLDSLCKPPRSLGGIEETAARLYAIQNGDRISAQKRRIIVMAADNGVCAEGISSAPKSVTLMQTKNIARGITGVAVLARRFGAEVEVVDVGVDTDERLAGVIDAKLMRGTNNIRVSAAMDRETAAKAVLTGIERAARATSDGIDAIGTGEMGIGNTTTSSAVLSVLTGLGVEEVTGRGAGLNDDAFDNKKRVISDAIAFNAPDASDPLDVISKVGGLDIAAMAGVFLGAALNRKAVVIDGFISIVAALTAYRMCPAVKDYMFASHASFEIGFARAAKELGIAAPFMLDMRLGEGSGCPMCFALMDAACAIYNDMATFDEASIDTSYLDTISQGDCFTVEE